MYFVPSRHGARAALAPEEKRQLGADNPFAGLFSDLFGGGNNDPTLTEPTTPATTPRTTTAVVVVTPTSTPTRGILPNTPSTPTTRTTPTTTSTTRPISTAQVVTSPPAPIVPASTSTSSVTLTSTSSNSTNTGATDASQGVSSSNSGLPSGVIGIIVAASVICGLIFLALIARKIFQLRRRSRRTTWARTSIIAPFEAPSGITEKALPPPPPQNGVEYTAYPAYPPAAMTYAQPIPYSPAAPSSAGYPAPYPFGGAGNTKIENTNASANPLNASSYTPADLAGAPPVVVQQPQTALTAGIPPSAAMAAAATVATATAVTGGICIVRRTFVPSLPDELSISNGEQVRVLSTYDDGWAMCEKVSSPERGMVPQECLEDLKSSSTNTNTPASQGSVDNAKMNRASSLKREQGTY